MSKVNRSKGNMYDWVTHTWSPLIGCPHQCSYCYVKTYQDLPVTPQLNGPFPNLGSDRTIFIGHQCDMFAQDFISSEDGSGRKMVEDVLDHCLKFNNTYVFQTKNPIYFQLFIERLSKMKIVLGTTIETNRKELLDLISKAPEPLQRAVGLATTTNIGNVDFGIPERFITIEPILDFDVEEFGNIIINTQPTFVNIGADSKKHGLPEPSFEKVMALVDKLSAAGIEIRKKLNLDRLINQEKEK